MSSIIIIEDGCELPSSHIGYLIFVQKWFCTLYMAQKCGSQFSYESGRNIRRSISNAW